MNREKINRATPWPASTSQAVPLERGKLIVENKQKETVKMKQAINHPSKKEHRRTLRNNLTPAEATLWLALKNKQLEGRRFRRQVSIGHYIVDFYCPREKLVVELDGENHFTEEGSKHDLRRDKYLNNLGLKVIRFENEIVFHRYEGVLEKIQEAFRQHP